mmetsp:Transcript_12843/g.32542  ORF Transcript_12843/g.32542 Transcript_12843/m.32542 type:complete len:232 (-) Transcript_12843:161-856(-)
MPKTGKTYRKLGSHCLSSRPISRYRTKAPEAARAARSPTSCTCSALCASAASVVGALPPCVSSPATERPTPPNPRKAPKISPPSIGRAHTVRPMARRIGLDETRSIACIIVVWSRAQIHSPKCAPIKSPLPTIRRSTAGSLNRALSSGLRLRNSTAAGGRTNTVVSCCRQLARRSGGTAAIVRSTGAAELIASSAMSSAGQTHRGTTRPIVERANRGLLLRAQAPRPSCFF